MSSMVKRILFVRHGETDCNSSNLIQGRGVDAPLNLLGKQQAEAFYKHYSSIPFDRIYTSSLIRTHQTMALFIEKGLPHQIDNGFDEMDFGEMEGKPMYDKDGNFTLEKLLEKWREGDENARVEGGESPLDVKTRLSKSLEALLDKRDEKTVVVCMHGRALRVLVCLLLNKPISNMEQYFHHNLAVTEFEYSYNSKEFRAVKVADCSHLEELKLS